LNEGVNTVTATVTAKSGASATYTIIVTRAPSPPTIAVIDNGITRTVTLTKPASCLSATLYYTTNGMDITIPENRIPYTGPLTAAGLGVQVEVKAISVLDSSTSVTATATTSIINYPNLGLNQAPAQLSLGDVNAAIAINGTLYYSNDYLRIKKSDSPYDSSTTLAGGVEFIDLDGNGLNARFDGITDMTTDGVNLYILTYTKLRKLDLSTMNVSTIASLPSGYSGFCSATTDGTYVYVQTFYRTSSSMGRFKISDGTFTPIVVDTGLIYTGIAWDGTTLYCSICPSNGINPGSLEQWTYTSSWILGSTTTLVNSGTRGVAVDGTNLYFAHNYRDSLYTPEYGPVTRTLKTTPWAIPDYLGDRRFFIYGRKLFTDGIWLYGYSSSNFNGFNGPLYIIKKNP